MASGGSGSEIRWRDGWISGIGSKPTRRIRSPYPVVGRELGIGREDVHALAREIAGDGREAIRGRLSVLPRGDRVRAAGTRWTRR